MKKEDCIKQAGTQHTIKSDLLKPISLTLVSNLRIYWDHINTLIKGKNVQQHITLQVENNELTSDPTTLLALVVQRLDNAIHRIKLDECYCGFQ